VRIAIFGAGGVGAYIGARLAEQGVDVRLIARGAHLDTIRDRGLRVDSIAGDMHVRPFATEDPAEAGVCDAVLVCVKSYDTESVASKIAPLLSPDSLVLSLQNGVDNEETLGSTLGMQHVVGGVAYVFATIKEPGVVVHSDGPGSIVFGELNGELSDRAVALADLCSDAGVPAECVVDIRSRLWQKYCVIIPQAGMTAISRAPIGAIRESEAAWGMFLRLTDEIIALAARERIQLPADMRSKVLGFVNTLDGATFSSLHYDLVHGKRLELNALHGYASRLGRARGLRMPACDAVVAALEPYLDGAGS
jgi:2-dehydropantoate 2-reductase